MIRQITIGCDWSDCRAELTFEFRTLRPAVAGWKVECEGVYSMHLCPDHARKSWNAVRDAQFEAGQAPSTSR